MFIALLNSHKLTKRNKLFHWLGIFHEALDLSLQTCIFFATFCVILVTNLTLSYL